MPGVFVFKGMYSDRGGGLIEEVNIVFNSIVALDKSNDGLEELVLLVLATTTESGIPARIATQVIFLLSFSTFTFWLLLLLGNGKRRLVLDLG